MLKPHRFALLLGAGFTKNFGGFLASEMWALLFNQKSVQSSPLLRQRMLQVPSCEDLFHDIVVKKQLSEPDRQAFLKACFSAYGLMDEVVSRVNFQNRIDYPSMNKQFLTRFSGPDDTSPGFIFSLNQDLWLERHYKEQPEPNLPSLRRHDHKQGFFKDAYQFPLRDPDDLVFLPNMDGLKETPVVNALGNFSFVKLHGSINFRSSIDPTLPVLGNGSLAEFTPEPLLKAYLELFREVIMAGGVKLLVIGYGFQNIRVNEIILKGLQDKKIQIYVLNPVDVWWSRQFFQSGIFEQLSGYFPYDLADLFPRNRSGDTVAWTELKRNYFEA